MSPSAPAYLLAGGRSSRFGADKARATVNGVPLIVRTARSLAAIAEGIWVVSDDAERYTDLGLPCITDGEPHLGPLGGLATALGHALAHYGPNNRPLLVACDQLELHQPWLEALLRLPANQCAAYCGAEQWEPFPGVYPVSLLPRVEQLLATGPRSLQGLLNACGTPVALPGDWPSPNQANTPLQLREYITRYVAYEDPSTTPSSQPPPPSGCQLVVFVGPKGSGKTTLAERCARGGLGYFLEVETIAKRTLHNTGGVIDELYTHEAFAAILFEVQRCAVTQTRLFLETTGAAEDAEHLIAALRARYPLRLIRVLAPAELCWDRITSRDAGRHVAVPQELVQSMHQRSAALRWPWDLELHNDASESLETLYEAVRNHLAPAGLPGVS